MKDGRSRRPPLPDFAADVNELRAVNLTLGTNYTPEQLDELPAAWIEKVILYGQAIANNG